MVFYFYFGGSFGLLHVVEVIGQLKEVLSLIDILDAQLEEAFNEKKHLSLGEISIFYKYPNYFSIYLIGEINDS